MNVIVLESITRLHFYQILPKALEALCKTLQDPNIKAIAMDLEFFQSAFGKKMTTGHTKQDCPLKDFRAVSAHPHCARNSCHNGTQRDTSSTRAKETFLQSIGLVAVSLSWR